MKKPKTVIPFFFKDMSHEDMIELLDNELPIDTRRNNDLINRVYSRYPLISKEKIAVIIGEVFQTFRDFIVLGKVLMFHNLFFDVKMKTLDAQLNGHTFAKMTVNVSTPPKLRKL